MLWSGSPMPIMHEIPQASFRIDLSENAAGVQDLGDDFAGPQVADESHLPGGAEHAAHRAAGLRADADGVPAGVAHEHRFDGLAVVEAQQELAGEAVAAVDLVHDFRGIQEKRFVLADVLPDPAFERRQEIARCRDRGSPS